MGSGRRNCNVSLDELRCDRPDVDCEPQQARGTPRNLELDETLLVLSRDRWAMSRCSWRVSDEVQGWLARCACGSPAFHDGRALTGIPGPGSELGATRCVGGATGRRGRRSSDVVAESGCGGWRSAGRISGGGGDAEWDRRWRVGGGGFRVGLRDGARGWGACGVGRCVGAAVGIGAAGASVRFVSGQRHLSGCWWSATDGRHVGFESWLERDHVMALDFDPAVGAIASQPFWLLWPAAEGGGRYRSHAPDYFVRRVDGSAVLVDCRPEHRRKPRDLVAFEMTRQACELVGWEYRLLGAPDQVVTANLRWLAGYRHPRYLDVEVADRLRAAFAEPVALMGGAAAAGDPIAALPVLFHLIWRHDLVIDLAVPLRGATPVRVGC